MFVVRAGEAAPTTVLSSLLEIGAIRTVADHASIGRSRPDVTVAFPIVAGRFADSSIVTQDLIFTANFLGDDEQARAAAAGALIRIRIDAGIGAEDLPSGANDRFANTLRARAAVLVAVATMRAVVRQIGTVLERWIVL